MASPPVTNRERERMREMRRQKMSVEDIGAELGRTGRCVWTHVADMEVKVRSGRPGMGEAAYDRLLAAHAAGVRKDELAARFGLKPSSVFPLINQVRKMRAGAAA